MVPLQIKMPSLPALPRNHQRLKVVLVQANLLVTIDLLSKESYRVSICVYLRLGLHLFPCVQVCIIMYLCPVCVVSLLYWPGCCCVSQMCRSVSEFGDAKSWPAPNQKHWTCADMERRHLHRSAMIWHSS